jgi:AraC-like DNA-binding protein
MYLTMDDSGVKNLVKPIGRNCVMYSEISQLETPFPFFNFAIKYVMKGCETYYVKGEEYPIRSGQYLLCNPHGEGSILIDSKQKVTGICIDISPDMVSEVVASLRAPDAPFADLSLDLFFSSPDFLEQSYSIHQTHLGHCLMQVESILQANPFEDYQFEPEFYYRLSEAVVKDYIPVVKQFQSIKSIKSATKRDLLKKLTRGKSFLDDYFSLPIDVEDAAQAAHISQYHFFRLFREVYGISPYQYIKARRLEKGKALITKDQMPIAQVALEVGYSDIFAFSKAYRQYFGVPPSRHQTF